jgi:hypothetical protein
MGQALAACADPPDTPAWLDGAPQNALELTGYEALLLAYVTACAALHHVPHVTHGLRMQWWQRVVDKTYEALRAARLLRSDCERYAVWCAFRDGALPRMRHGGQLHQFYPTAYCRAGRGPARWMGRTRAHADTAQYVTDGLGVVRSVGPAAPPAPHAAPAPPTADGLLSEPAASVALGTCRAHVACQNQRYVVRNFHGDLLGQQGALRAVVARTGC